MGMLQGIVGGSGTPQSRVADPLSQELLVVEDFSSGALAVEKWTAFSGGTESQVTGTPYVAEPPEVSVRGVQYYSGITWPNDHSSEVTRDVVDGTADVWVRVQPDAYSGYVASSNTAGGINLYKCVAGVFTELGSGGSSGLLPVAGDVVTLTVAGALLTVYYNDVPVMRYMDYTFTSGYPGFSQYSGTAVTDSKVTRWRGYSTVQQDGVWQKQGIVIPEVVADGQYGVVNATMLYESGAQLLSGTVYKIWFSNGSGDICYAESTDGIAWTRKAEALISGFGFPYIIKDGTTYHLYVQGGSGGSGNFAHYTSSDGITWSQQSTNVFGLGGAGQWDDTIIWYFQPVAIIDGTWYALYCAGNNGTSYQLKLGLATSTDGASWTRSPSNPVLTAPHDGSVVNGGAIAKVGDTYYMWVYGSQPGMSGDVPNLDPGEGVRYQTVDFVNWTNPVHSVHMTEPFEGVNFKTGQTFPNGIFTVGNRTFMYLQTAASDNNPTMGYQLTLAVAPVPLDLLVQYPEDAMAQLESDDFTSGEGDLSASWTTPTGLTKLQIVAGPYVEATATSEWCGMRHSVAVGDNHWSEITVQSSTSDEVAGPAVRMQANGDCYFAQCTFSTGGNNIIYKRVGGVNVALSKQKMMDIATGDRLRLSVIGNIITLYQNDFQVLRVEDYTADVPSGGKPGMLLYATTLAHVQVSAWAGGNSGVLPY